MIFSPYGNFHIKTFDDVVGVTLYGSSDRKIISNLAEDLSSIARQYRDKSWAVIFNVVYWDYSPPQVLNLKIKELYQKEDANFPRFIFFLVSDKKQESHIKNQYMFQNIAEVIYIRTFQEAVEILRENEIHGFSDRVC